MAPHLFELLRGYLAHYGYWTIAIVLLLENAGVPVPGETILLLASFLAYSEHKLQLPYIILVATAAATFGDNLGFVLGHYGGRPFLRRYGRIFGVSEQTLSRGEKLFRRYGAATILVARFIAGLRIIAGPLAGVLRMHWRKFALLNFLGAALWVAVIAGAGYLFGRHWDELVRLVRGANFVLLAVVVLVLVWLWIRRRKTTNANP